MVAMKPSLQTIRDEFTELLPQVAGRLSRRFRHSHPEARSEAVAEGLAHSWLVFLSARQREKNVTAATLAFYSGRMVEAGRKVAGNSVVDALADTPLSRKRVGRHVSLDTPGLPYAAFYSVFGDRRGRWPVIDLVAARVDFHAFHACCSLRDQQIIEMRLAGHAQTEIAGKLGVTSARVCQRLRHLRIRWEATSVA